LSNYGLNVRLSKKAMTLFSPLKMEKIFKEMNHGIALAALGLLPESPTNRSQNPLQAGFGPLKGGGNAKTKEYPGYCQGYKEGKIKRTKYWLTQSGRLYEASINQATVRSSPTSVTITAAPTAYGAIHQDGGKIMVTVAMRKFFMAMALHAGYDATKVSSKNKKATKAAGAKVAFWWALYGKQVGDYIVIPQRKYYYLTDADVKKLSRWAAKFLISRFNAHAFVEIYNHQKRRAT
jgi:phage gpG-like protein